MSSDKLIISRDAWCRWCKHCDDDIFCLEHCNAWHIGRPKAYCDKRGEGCECCNSLCKNINHCQKTLK